MLSVVVYGRNDSYGYNLHKRASISLNCIAEVLTHPGDEILFVDCNTPDDMPTFPEAIQDTLTDRAKSLLRILRLRPEIYDRYKKGSPLKTLEPLSRNIAIRRSNPNNRWILSTNTDMVFITRNQKKSLSDIVAEIQDGFYELPRFEVTEALWETVDRTEPGSIIAAFKRWGQRLHLNEVVISRPDIRYDCPGDFQLMLREQIFAIHGFDEEMIRGWHVDSNICKRLYLLNGKTDSLIEHVFAYHCDHTRQATFLHSSSRTENDSNRFVYNVTSPFLESQMNTWGIHNETLEEIRLTDDYKKRFSNILENLLPGMAEPTTTDVFLTESYNHSQIYDNLHVVPFLADHLSNIHGSANIGYVGGNMELLSLINAFLDRSDHKGNLLVDYIIGTTYPNGCLNLHGRCILSDPNSLIEQSDLFIFDNAMMHFPKIISDKGISFPKPSKQTDYFKHKLKVSFLMCVKSEIKRLRSGLGSPRKFILISSQHSWFEGVTSKYINTVLTPYSCHVRHGYVFIPSEISGDSSKAVSTDRRDFPMSDYYWRDAANFVIKYVEPSDRLLCPPEFGSIFYNVTFPYHLTFIEDDMDVQWAVIHRGTITDIDPVFLNHIRKTMKPVFANEAFFVFAKDSELSEVDLFSDTFWHETALFVEKHIHSEERLVGPAEFGILFPSRVYPYTETSSDNTDIQWVIIHKGMIAEIDPIFLSHTRKTMKPVFANEVFVIYSNHTELAEIDNNSAHYKSFLEGIFAL